MTLNKFDRYLKSNLHEMIENGYLDENPRGRYEDGTPSHSLSKLGGSYEIYDLSKGELPITLTRSIPWKSSTNEMLVIYQDQSNKIADFIKRNCLWWKPWDIGDSTIGIRYGETIRRYDLVNKLLKGLTNDPFSKRHLIDLYQYIDLEESDGLHPCAFLSMWTVSKRETSDKLHLDLTLVMRSSDFLVAGSGVNHLQYVALQMMIAKHCGYEVGLFEIYRKNIHIYDRHEEQCVETLKRLEQLETTESTPEPKLVLNVPDGTNFYDIKIEDFEMLNYEPIKPQLKFQLAI